MYDPIHPQTTILSYSKTILILKPQIIDLEGSEIEVIFLLALIYHKLLKNSLDIFANISTIQCKQLKK